LDLGAERLEAGDRVRAVGPSLDHGRAGLRDRVGHAGEHVADLGGDRCQAAVQDDTDAELGQVSVPRRRQRPGPAGLFRTAGD
jgi:hypothetical protein